MGYAEPELIGTRIGSRIDKRVLVTAELSLKDADKSYSVFIRDLSQTGARIESQTERYEVGQVVQLRLPLLPLRRLGEIVWATGKSAGIIFDESLDQLTFRLLIHEMRRGEPQTDNPAALSDTQHDTPAAQSQPRAERAEVAIGANCRTATGRRGFVAMIDLTPEGCCLFGRDNILKIGSSLVLQPENMAPLHAKVQWSEGSLTGVLFDVPLYPPVFEHLAKTYPWTLSEGAKRAVLREERVSPDAERELLRLMERAQRAFTNQNEKRDVLTTRPPIPDRRFWHR